MLHKYFDCFFLLLSFLAIIRGKTKARIVTIHLKTNYSYYRYNTNTHLHIIPLQQGIQQYLTYSGKNPKEEHSYLNI